MGEGALTHGVAVAVAVDPDGPLAGALLLGPSASGKSALALRLIEECPWRRTALVADDAVLLKGEGGRIIARAPERIAGLIEVRGFGPARVRRLEAAPMLAAFDLSAPESRLPEPAMREYAPGIALALWPFRAGEGGPARLRAALRSILGGQTL